MFMEMGDFDGVLITGGTDEPGLKVVTGKKLSLAAGIGGRWAPTLRWVPSPNLRPNPAKVEGSKGSETPCIK